MKNKIIWIVFGVIFSIGIWWSAIIPLLKTKEPLALFVSFLLVLGYIGFVYLIVDRVRNTK